MTFVERQTKQTKLERGVSSVLIKDVNSKTNEITGKRVGRRHVDKIEDLKKSYIGWRNQTRS